MKRTSEVVYYGSVKCQGLKKSGELCTNGAYYEQKGQYLCGCHSDKNKRKELPKDKDEKRRKLALYEEHKKAVTFLASSENREKGKVQCYKMGMMKNVPLFDGYLNIFPNNKHQNRVDGFGCASLSPMQLGPVVHRQPGLPDSLNIENYHQYNKVWPNEVDKDKNPLPLYEEKKRAAYRDPVPHRHKYDLKEMKKLREQVNGQNRNQPLYSIHLTLDGEKRRFTYVESRYFYCKAYEVLAKKTKDFGYLRKLRENGTHLMICGYDAYEVTRPLYDHYCDEVKAFGHELVLYTLLTVKDPVEYPWNVYREKHADLYRNIAHVVEQ